MLEVEAPRSGYIGVRMRVSVREVPAALNV